MKFDIAIETWYVGDGRELDFAYTSYDMNSGYVDQMRQLHFDKYKVSPVYLKRLVLENYNLQGD